MTRIAAQEIEQMKANIAVAALVESSGVALRRAGKDLLGLCPFHADGEASLVITPAKNLWHCFACQIGGGPIDWVMKARGVSFRHAVELLRNDPAQAVEGVAGRGPIKVSGVRTLPAPISLEADAGQVLNQVADFYHATLQASSEAQAYLASRGLWHAELVSTFKLGYANRTLGLHLPEKNRIQGEALRSKLAQVGVLRESGHEHLAGSLVVPIIAAGGRVQGLYGRKITAGLRKGTPNHLYLPGPHRGVWNEAGLAGAEEIILCEALLDAMSIWCAGWRQVTAAYGVEGLTQEHLDVFVRNGVKRVLIAFDADASGELGAEKAAQRLQAQGMACWRMQFPAGMDANAFACSIASGAADVAEAMGAVVRKARWMGEGAAPARVQARDALAQACAQMQADAQAGADEQAQAHTHTSAQADARTYTYTRASAQADAHTHERAQPGAQASAQPGAQASTQPGAAPALPEDGVVRVEYGPCAYRVRGLLKNSAPEVMKINLLVARGEAFHMDSFDVFAAKGRNAFISAAAAALGEREEAIRQDLGKLLLHLEQLQDVRIKQGAQSAGPAAPVMSAAAENAARAWLRGPGLMARLAQDLDAVGIIGERANKLVGYLAATSRKLAAPLAVVIRSSSAAGKTSLMDAVLSLMPAEEKVKYSAMSGQSLFYMGQANLKHKILALAEEEGASKASYALKILQSEGELTMASTGKDATTGILTTQEYKVEGPVMLFTTTTALDIDPELLNRCLVLTVDEGREQTQAIHQVQRRRRTLEGIASKAERGSVLELHQNVQRLLKPLAVVNPFAEQLTFPDHATRTRRDHEKYLTLIDAIALLHQHQRDIKTVQVRGQAVAYIEVKREDIAHANALAHEVLGRSLDELPPQTRTLLRGLCGMVDGLAQAQGVGRQEVRFTRRQVREALGMSNTQVHTHIERLQEFEYVFARRVGNSGWLEYELAFDGDPDGAAPHLPGLLHVDAEEVRL